MQLFRRVFFRLERVTAQTLGANLEFLHDGFLGLQVLHRFGTVFHTPNADEIQVRRSAIAGIPCSATVAASCGLALLLRSSAGCQRLQRPCFREKRIIERETRQEVNRRSALIHAFYQVR